MTVLIRRRRWCARRSPLGGAIAVHLANHCPDYDGLLGQIEANLSYDLRARAGEITVPTLITVGELDYLLPVAASEELHRAIPGSELVVFPGAPHLVTMEAPDRFNEVTLDWLRKIVDRV